MRWPRQSAAVILCAALTGVQDGKPPATYAALLKALAGSSDAARVKTLRGFVAGRKPAELATLRARLLLGAALLRQFQLAAARAEFDLVVKNASRRQRDVAARARYGVAQCAELLGDKVACRAALDQLVRDYADLRFARYGRAARERLGRAGVVRIGSPAPAFDAARDLDGKSRSFERGKPLLLLFAVPDDARSQRRVDRLLAAWRAGGGGAEQVLLFAIHRSAAVVRQVVKARKWTVPVVHCGGVFLDPVVLQFGVQSVPDSFLIGPDQRLLLRSPKPARLREAARVLGG